MKHTKQQIYSFFHQGQIPNEGLRGQRRNQVKFHVTLEKTNLINSVESTPMIKIVQTNTLAGRASPHTVKTQTSDGV